MKYQVFVVGDIFLRFVTAEVSGFVVGDILLRFMTRLSIRFCGW